MPKTWILFLLFLLSPIFLSAENHPLPDLSKSGMITSLDTDPTGLIDGCVSVISGQYVEQEIDLTVPGPIPLTVGRTWVQGRTH